MGKPFIPLEIIDVSPFNTKFLTAWDEICRNAIAIYSEPLDNFLACFIPTTQELKRPFHRYAFIALALPFWALCTILTLPIGIIFILLWLPISSLRLPYRYSFVKNAPKYQAKREYTCATTNVCLLYECLTRFNNQKDTYQKAIRIGRNIATQQEDVQNNIPFDSTRGGDAKMIEKLRDEKLAFIGVAHREENVDDYWGKVNKINQRSIKKLGSKNGHRSSDVNGTHGGSNCNKSDADFDHSILSSFPPTDFLLVQESWLMRSSKALVKELHRVYPYIVYDARVDSLSTNYFMLGSGTMIASKYPIMDVRFNCYRCGIKQCRLASKGLLQVKVCLGKLESGKTAVGYLANTHLQAYQGTHPIHSQQMDLIIQWTEEFRHQTRKAGEEEVSFDIIGGDFNTDNMSPVDKRDWDHQLFSIYEDVCRVAPGLDRPWTVGTEMAHTPLDDPLIKTPLGLQMALRNPFLLQHYVLNADIADACLEIAHIMPERDARGEVVLSPVGGRRRIDYVLYRKGDGVSVNACNIVTQLAGLTDHIPSSLTFTVRP